MGLVRRPGNAAAGLGTACLVWSAFIFWLVYLYRSERAYVPQLPVYHIGDVIGATTADDRRAGFLGWSGGGGYRWSDGRRVGLRFAVPPAEINQPEYLVHVRTLVSLGRQPVSVSVNGTTIGSFVVENAGTFNVRFPVRLLRERNTVMFDLPEARRPGTGDPRVLGIGMSEFAINTPALENTPIYEIGDVVTALDGDAAAADHWAREETGFSWAGTGTASFRFRPATLEPAKQSWRLRLCALGAAQPVQLSIVLDGTPLGRVEVGLPRTISLPVARDLLRPGRLNELTFRREPRNREPDSVAVRLFSFTIVSPVAGQRLPVYVPGDMVSFADETKMHFFGWSQPEVRHRWSQGRKAGFRFRLPPSVRSGKPYLLKLDVPLLNGKQNVIVLLNGGLLGTVTVEAPGRAEVKIPAGLLDAGSTNEITLYFPNAARPPNGDPRLLGIAISDVSISECK